MHARQSRAKGNTFYRSGQGQILPLTSMVELAILYETLPPPLFQLSVGWHAWGMVMELSRVSLSHLFFLSLVEPRGLWFKTYLTRVKYYLNHV